MIMGGLIERSRGEVTPLRAAHSNLRTRNAEVNKKKQYKLTAPEGLPRRSPALVLTHIIEGLGGACIQVRRIYE